MIIFSDLHLHSMHPVVGLDYLNLGISALKQVREFAVKHDDRLIIHLGDVFQLKDRIPVRVWNAFFEEMVEWKKEHIESIWLMGNHDFQTHTTLKAFSISPFMIPITTSVLLTVQGKECVFQPYGKSERIYGDYLFMHDFFKGHSVMGNDIVAEEGMWDEEYFESFDYVLSGHAHKYQQFRNMFHIGSPYQVNFNEVGQDKFFAQIKAENLKFHYFSFPEFKIVEIDSNVDVKGCYVKLVYETGDAEAKAFREHLLEKGALAVKLEPQNKVVIKQRVKVKGKEKVDYLQAYVEEKALDLDKEKVYTMGVKVMESIT